MKELKRVVAIHDISGFGKCSLTVALPIISAAGIETTVLPTAVLSTHTGGFTDFTYRDLTDDIQPIADQLIAFDREKIMTAMFYYLFGCLCLCSDDIYGNHRVCYVQGFLHFRYSGDFILPIFHFFLSGTNTVFTDTRIYDV
jgi:hypothetical protein